MSLNIELINDKIHTKYRHLQHLLKLLSHIVGQFQKVSDVHEPAHGRRGVFFVDWEENIVEYILDKIADLTDNLEELYRRYNNDTCPMLLSYYQGQDSVGDDFQRVVVSGNFLNSLDHIFNYVKRLVFNLETFTASDKKKFADFQKQRMQLSDSALDAVVFIFEDKFNLERTGAELNLSFEDVYHKYLENYHSIQILLPTKVFNSMDCECGGSMILDPNTSFKMCEKCGFETYIFGTMTDDIHITQDASKHRKYDSNRHCEKHLNQIQAQEDISIPSLEKVVNKLDRRAVKEFTKNGMLRSMKSMTCRQVRSWLKEFGLTTKWNEHAALLRKNITSLHGETVIPPQLTSDEKEEILMEFSIDMNIYEELIKEKEYLQLINRDKVKNKPYYPFCLLKVLCQKLRGDPRLPGLIECIHFQSSSTNIKNDKTYKEICKRRGKKFEATDRTILVDNR